MMPVVRLPDPIYQRLQAIAVPFEDTPVTVIERLLNEYELRNKLQHVSEAEAYRICDLNEPNFRHTRVIRAVIAGEEVSRPNWSKIVDETHYLATQQGLPVEALIKLTLSNAVKGEIIHFGFHYLPKVGISVQGVDANLAWRNTLHLAKNLKIPVEVYFEWRDKEGAAHPGEKGKLTWIPE